MKTFRYIFVFSLLLVTSCAKDIVDLTGSISGTVKDYDDGQLIANCQITISPAGVSRTTGSDGQFEFGGLEPGTYTLSFKKSGYEDEAKTVSLVSGQDANVPLTIKRLKAVISVAPLKLEFGNSTATLSVTVSNTGRGNLEWSVSENADWLNCSPTDGSVLPQQSATVVVSVNRDGLEKGNYNENLIVSSNVGNATVSVSMAVAAINLNIEPSILDFGVDGSSLQVSMNNPSGKTLKYAITTSNNWISVSKTGGSITTADSFNVVVSRSGLSAGNYDGNVVIAANGDEISIPVKMVVAEKSRPSVAVEEVGSITSSGAVVKAAVKSIGSAKVTRYGVCWSKSAAPTLEDKFTNLGDCTGAKSYECTITELDSETKYYVRAYAENTEGLVYSERTMSFTTSAKPTIPSVSTLSVTNVTATSATASGRIISLGNVAKVIEHGHVWGTSSQPTISSCAHTSLGESNSAKDFSSSVMSLSAGTKYYIRAYAKNTEGIAYGDEVCFTTKDLESPTVTIGQASDISKNSFNVSGEITSTGGLAISGYGHCWSTSQNPTTSDSKTSLGSGAGEGSFRSTVTALAEGTTYYVRAYAVNAKGTSYSEQIAVTTSEGTTDKWDGSKASSFAGGSGTTVDPYQIETGAQFVLIKDYTNKCFILNNNINLDNRSWPAIEFSGTLDGNGYTVSNLKISRTEDNLGLFSVLSGTVKNLNINGVNIQSGTSANIGTVAGRLKPGGNITNCNVVLTDDSKILGDDCVGGFVGYYGSKYNEYEKYKMTISKCTLTSSASANTILGNSRVGGIAGFMGSHSSSMSLSITVENCHVNAMIYGASYVGGVCGAAFQLYNYSYITNCSFDGTVSGESRVGGILGANEEYSGKCFTVTGCKANAKITTTNDYAGGIFGDIQAESEVVACYATGLLECENADAKYLGGIGGCSRDGSSNQVLCYSAVSSSNANFSYICKRSSQKDCASVASCDNITEYLQSCYSEYANYYNFNNTWTWSGKVNGSTKSVSCPKLNWE